MDAPFGYERLEIDRAPPPINYQPRKWPSTQPKSEPAESALRRATTRARPAYCSYLVVELDCLSDICFGHREGAMCCPVDRSACQGHRETRAEPE
eukprot:gene2575-biopygen11545